ncbi:MAG: S8 family serine peptidase [Candidatus Aquicultor sp.]|nr:S8 family serine peptidase [Candidatus Aquicultor sp.]
MRFMRNTLILFLVLSLLVVAVPVFASDRGASGKVNPDRLLVKFKDGVSNDAKRGIHLRHGATVVGEVAGLGVQIVEVGASKASEREREYQAESSVEYVEPDYMLEAFVDDPGLMNQWGLNNVGQIVNGIAGTIDADIDAWEAWDVTTSTPDVIIAILDTGIDQDHADLAGQIIGNKNFTSSGTVDDLYGHGTHVAGIAAAAANNGIGVAGLAYGAGIMNVKVLGDDGSGYTSWVASGINWAADNGAKVINMSLGGSTGSRTLESAINYAWSKGVVVVAAGGNSASSAKQYPAAYTNCIAVAATDQNDNKAYFSSFGSKWIDVAAPGVNIYSTLPNHSNRIGGTDYGYLSGTSMSTPYVAGLAALVWSTGYGNTATNVRGRIVGAADKPVSGNIYKKYGIPRINAFKAVMP